MREESKIKSVRKKKKNWNTKRKEEGGGRGGGGRRKRRVCVFLGGVCSLGDGGGG